MTYVLNIIFDLRIKNQWSDYNLLIERIVNIQVHSVTKVSPAQIIDSNSIDLDGMKILNINHLLNCIHK